MKRNFLFAATLPALLAIPMLMLMGSLALAHDDHGKGKDDKVPAIAQGERQIQVKVDGMHCQDCVNRARKALKTLETEETGKLKVAVVISQNKAYINLKEGTPMDVEKIRAALEKSSLKLSGVEGLN